MHKELQLVLSVYVDDFKMAGLTDNISKGWDLIRSKIRLDPPTKLADYLGCGQESFWMNKDAVRETMSRIAPHVLGDGVPRETASDPTAAGGGRPFTREL